MASLIYLHGCNGSGKSTLARTLIMCSGGIKSLKRHKATGGKCTYTNSKLTLVGWYKSPTGGADGVQPYALVCPTALALLAEGKDVLIEGLMSPGIATCQKLYKDAKKLGAYVRFIRLDIGYHQAVENVKRRRMLVGNTKPYDPINLKKKQDSCNHWLTNLAAAHLPIYGLNWQQAKDLCMQAYNLDTEGATRILE